MPKTENYKNNYAFLKTNFSPSLPLYLSPSLPLYPSTSLPSPFLTLTPLQVAIPSDHIEVCRDQRSLKHANYNIKKGFNISTLQHAYNDGYVCDLTYNT